jgi:hypothetical protein
LEKFQKQDRARAKRLRSQAKQPYELLITGEFKVGDIQTESYASRFTPTSEIMVGGTSPSYGTGMSLIHRIEVIPKSKNVRGIEVLTFEGALNINPGSLVSATVPLYKMVTENGIEVEGNALDFFRGEKFYLPRKPGKEETAIELVVPFVSGRSNYVHTFRSCDWKKYQKG